MSKIKLFILTPIHIGNNVELQGNFEYLYFANEHKIAILDAEKVLKILGEENISQWVAAIDNKTNLLPILEQRSPGLKSEDVALRAIPLDTFTNRPIKTQIRSGNGEALIPGSSIKGAIRTAVFAELILDNPELVNDRRNLGTQDYNRGIRWTDVPISKMLLGNDPNHDIFRLLHVGDFEFSTTKIYETNAINKKFNTWEIKKDITQFVEAVLPSSSSDGQIKFNDLLFERAPEKYFNSNAQNLKLIELFALINDHTLRLVEDEYNYWTEKADNPEPLGDYVDHLESIKEIIGGCNENECVLRLGWGSGFRFMTGDWQGEMTDDDYFSLVKSLRPKHPEDLIFPKSTRFISGGTPLGFLKLQLE